MKHLFNPHSSLLKAFALLSLLHSGAHVADAKIVSKTVTIRQGKFRYHYDDAIPTDAGCATVAMIGVGTAMSVGSYDNISSLISTGKPVVTVVTDHAKYSFIKLSRRKYANFYNKFVDNIEDYLPVCKGKDPMILAGAHSASGQAAINAFAKGVNRKPDGFIGLDPFNVNERKMKIDASIPTLDWGFAKTTCAVKVNQAAKAAYEISSKAHRVLYRVNNISKKIAHCVFTDKGCAIVCGKKKDGGWVPPAVAESIHNFIDAIKTFSFTPGQFALPSEHDGCYELFVNMQDPDVTT